MEHRTHRCAPCAHHGRGKDGSRPWTMGIHVEPRAAKGTHQRAHRNGCREACVSSIDAYSKDGSPCHRMVRMAGITGWTPSLPPRAPIWRNHVAGGPAASRGIGGVRVVDARCCAVHRPRAPPHPVVLSKNHLEAWLVEGRVPSSPEVVAWAVGMSVNRTTEDGPHLSEPIPTLF